METIVGLLFWGGLLVLASRGVLRMYRGPSSSVPVTPPRPVVPPTRSLAAQSTVEESARESGALVDGLIIGHHLTRSHYEERLAEQAEAIESLRNDVAEHTYPGGDDLDDDDGMGGGDAVGFYGGFGAVDADEFGSDELAAGDDLWEDDVFSYDEDDDY